MLRSLIKSLKCENCGGNLHLSESDTIISYKDTVDLSARNLIARVDDIIGRHLVFTCLGCGAEYRLTYSDVERALRREMTQKMLLLIVQNEMRSSSPMEPVFVYCGKCTGYDGRGACPRSLYNKCEIKRFPVDV